MPQEQCIPTDLPEHAQAGAQMRPVHHGVYLGDGWYLNATGADENTVFRLCRHDEATQGFRGDVEIDAGDLGAAVALGQGKVPVEGVVQILGGKAKRAALATEALGTGAGEELEPLEVDDSQGQSKPELKLVGKAGELPTSSPSVPPAQPPITGGDQPGSVPPNPNQVDTADQPGTGESGSTGAPPAGGSQ